MRALQVINFTSAPEIRQVPAGKSGENQLKVVIEACGLNFADLLMMKGTYQDTPEPPFTMGLEVCGRVIEAGASVAHVKIGDRVAIFAGSGGLATEGVFDADRAVKVPDTMSPSEAAGFQVAYGTSHLALTRRARLVAGETLVVLGAAGGVGLTAVEIGAALGARVIAVARGADKLAVAQKAGAHHLIDSEETDIRTALKDLGGVDVVYDPVGGDQFKSALRACKPEARILTIGFASGEVPPVPANILLVKNIDVIGFYWGGYLAFAPEVLRQSMADLFALYENGQLRPHISHEIPFEDAVSALELLRSRKATGKVVVTMPAPA